MCTDLRLLNPRNFRLSVRNLDFDEPMDHWVGFVPDGTTFRSIERDRPNQRQFCHFQVDTSPRPAETS